MNRYTSSNNQQEGIKDWIRIGFIGLAIILIWSCFQGGTFLLINGTIWIIGLTLYNISKIKKNKILSLKITDDSITIQQKSEELKFNWEDIDVFIEEKGIIISDRNKMKLGIYKTEWNNFSTIQIEIEKCIQLKTVDSKPQSLIDTILNGLLPWS